MSNVTCPKLKTDLETSSRHWTKAIVILTYKIGDVSVSTKELTWEIILNAYGMEDILQSMWKRHPEFCAKKKLNTIAKFLNNGWKWKPNDRRYAVIEKSWYGGDNLEVIEHVDCKFCKSVMFKTTEIASPALKIMGDDIYKIDEYAPHKELHTDEDYDLIF